MDVSSRSIDKPDGSSAAAGLVCSDKSVGLVGEWIETNGVAVFRRTKDERDANPERLNLDRRQLQSCAVLQGEERVRLLNYQNNMISEIRNIFNLPNLIFLDLYNNQIKKIANLENVPTLRVLMLGKNCLEKIEGLGHLVRLDVLDLRSNSITI